MTTLQDTSPNGTTPDTSHQALRDFRARAQRLFKSQQERIRSLEQAIAEQLDADGEPSSAGASDSGSAVSSREEQDLRAQLAQARKLLNVRADELKRLRAQVAAATSGSTKSMPSDYLMSFPSCG
ncbi:MAG: hypothetical protein CMJ64_03345 [Planctomycetaceae bacterium]|nr:hypothetical protein [Planctomycetaceae bacterium]